jgi:hypothetical protein
MEHVMECKCRDCGSTNIELTPDEKDWMGTFGGAGANIGINNIWAGLDLIGIEDIPKYLANQATCDHLASGNACCPCGHYLNEEVKAVCSYAAIPPGKPMWFTPYGKKGLSLEDAEKELESIKRHLVVDVDSMDEAGRLEVMWDRQMINGETYITRLREIGDKKKEACERLK